MPTHNHDLDPFRIRPTWLSAARTVEGARVARSITRPVDPFTLPFCQLPASVNPEDRPVLELFLRAAERFSPVETHRCSGCADVFKKSSLPLGKAAELARMALPSGRSRQSNSTATVLLDALIDPLAQARRFARSIEPMPAEDYVEHRDWWNVYLDQYVAIGLHVEATLAALTALCIDNPLALTADHILRAQRWEIRNYIDPWREQSGAQGGEQVERPRTATDLFTQ